MKNAKIDIKKYISDNILYNEKLPINKNTDIDEIYNKYYTLYQNDWTQLPLKVDEKHFLHINYKILQPILEEFKKISQIVETKKDKKEKFLSSLQHEIFNNLLIEGYVSSRKIIADIVNDKENDNTDMMLNNIYNAMNYISQNRKINKDNISFLYKLLTNDIDMGEEKLDGLYYRNDDVAIGTHDKGINSKLIDAYMNDLLNFINQDINDDWNKIIQSIIIHFYFEFIHPYYDFNGRTGRMLVLWYAYNNNIYNYLAFFSTTISAYRDQYLKIFKETRFNQTLDVTYFVANILNMLIKQKYQYFNLLQFDQYLIQTYNKKLNAIQKDIIMHDQALRDIYNLDYFSVISLSKILNKYKEYSSQLIYREIKKLEEYGILKRIDKRNAGYYIEYKKIMRK